MFLSAASAIGGSPIPNRAPAGFLSDQPFVGWRIICAQKQIGVVIGGHTKIILTGHRRDEEAAEAVCIGEIGASFIYEIVGLLEDGDGTAFIAADLIVNRIASGWVARRSCFNGRSILAREHFILQKASNERRRVDGHSDRRRTCHAVRIVRNCYNAI